MRGSEERGQIGDLVQQWKKKDKENYRLRVVQKCQVKLQLSRKPREIPTAAKEESDCSDLSFDGGSPQPVKKKPQPKKKTKSNDPC